MPNYRFQQSIAFDGAGNLLTLTPTQPIVSFVADDAYSISGWIYPTNLTGDQAILAIDTTLEPNGLIFGLQNGKLALTTLESGAQNELVSTGSSLVLNQWQHVGVSVANTGGNGRSVSFYLNGVLDDSDSYTAANFDLATLPDLLIGGAY